MRPLPARLRAAAVPGTALALLACGAPEKDTPGPAAAAERPVFSEVAAQVGLSFGHESGAAGNYYLPEINGAGGALLDYDGDGDLDVYLIQSGRVPGTVARVAPGTLAPPGNRLFRNRLIPSGALGFDDVTDLTGGGDSGYGMGVASGDYDNDGDVDLYVMNLGDNVLYRNDNGQFTDVTQASGTNVSDWSAGGTFFDYDRDGDLDLFVVNYVDWHVDKDKSCEDKTGQRDYCAPSNFDPVSDRLLRNDGDGTFTDVSSAAGIATAAGPGLGVVAADYDGDGRTDLYVANDGQANHLWLYRGDGGFEETALRSGSAYNAHGAAEASMGVTAGDFDGDGDNDLFMTHLTSQSNTLYVNDGSGNFEDGTVRANLSVASMPFTGFGSAWFDYDNDSYLDLFIANGAVLVLPERRGLSDYPYEQTNQLFHNQGNGRFRDVSAQAGPAMALVEVSRGAAFGDVDNDGDIDVLVTNNNGPVRLLRNDIGQDHHWLRLHLVGSTSPRDAQGARVALISKQGEPRWQRAHSDGSYASAGDVRVLFGLGNDPALAAVQVVWPSGRNERWDNLATDTEHRLREGSGSPVVE